VVARVFSRAANSIARVDWRNPGREAIWAPLVISSRAACRTLPTWHRASAASSTSIWTLSTGPWSSDDPALRGVRVAVGGAGARGGVAAASYEARKFGVHSVTARRKCPEPMFVSPRFDVYRAMSLQIRGIFARYTSVIQPLLLEEAYLDVTAPLVNRGSAIAIAEEIRARIRAETGLTASAGVSYNKFLAKLASDYRKPDGLFVITPRIASAFVERLPIGKFHGVGSVTAAKMNKLGIRTGLDLRQQTRAFLTTHFGKTGDYFYHLARAQDDRPAVADEPRKLLGAETTFARDVRDWEDVAPALEPVFAKLWAAYSRHGLTAQTVTVKIKYANFQQITHRRSCSEAITSRAIIEQLSLDLLRPHFPPSRGVRLLGVALANFDVTAIAENRQIALALR
jgi:DNA polymerase IV